MARYIDADWIYEKVENRYRLSSGIEHRCERDLLDLICSAPTADVVEVVRCKDCRHWYSPNNDDKHCCRIAHGLNGIVAEEDFCSYGRR